MTQVCVSSEETEETLEATLTYHPQPNDIEYSLLKYIFHEFPSVKCKWSEAMCLCVHFANCQT